MATQTKTFSSSGRDPELGKERHSEDAMFSLIRSLIAENNALKLQVRRLTGSDYRKYQGYGAGGDDHKYQGYGAGGTDQYKSCRADNAHECHDIKFQCDLKSDEAELTAGNADTYRNSAGKQFVLREDKFRVDNATLATSKESSLNSCEMKFWRPCKYCGIVHRFGSRKCPAFGKECRCCSGKNHFARVCWNKKKKKIYEFQSLESKTKVTSEMTEKVEKEKQVKVESKSTAITDFEVASENEIKTEASSDETATKSDNSEEDDKVYSETQITDKYEENKTEAANDVSDDENISERTEAMEKWVANEFVLISKRKKMSKGSTEKEKWRAAANERQRTFMEQWL